MCYRSQTEAAASFSSPPRRYLFVRRLITPYHRARSFPVVRRADVEIVSVTDADIQFGLLGTERVQRLFRKQNTKLLSIFVNTPYIYINICSQFCKPFTFVNLTSLCP